MTMPHPPGDAPPPHSPAPIEPSPTPPDPRLARLKTSLTATVLLPGDPDWDQARQAWQLLVDQRPAAVVVARGVDDVVATVTAAGELGLRVAPQSTGHAAGTLSSLEGTVLLRTSALDEVTVDAPSRTARVGAGAVWGQVAAAAGEHGLAAVAGMSPTVGVVGFLLGGGLGWFGRSHGLGIESLLAVEAVDGRGRIVLADAATNPDLFWAIRHGLAPVVVTAVRIRLHPIAQVYAGALLWPLEQADAVVRAWREWIADVPDTVTSLARILRLPPLPELPEPLRGRSFVGVEVAIQGDEGDAVDLLRPLRALGPEIDMVALMPSALLGLVHNDPPDPAPAIGVSVVLGELSPEAIEAFLGAALQAAAAPLLSVELRHLGGALVKRTGPGQARRGIDGQGIVYAVGIVPVPEAAAPVAAAGRAVLEALGPHASGDLFKNFEDEPVGAERLYGDTLERLRGVAAEWDPDGLVHSGHAVA